MKEKKIVIYTDGSSLGNPGKGGWGVIFFANEKVMEMGGYQEDTTNNRMELQAILSSFEKMSKKKISGYKVRIFSDSMYCIDGITKWIDGWKKKDWKNSQKKPVKNKRFWEKIDDLKSFIEEENEIEFIHVKAHSGHKYNERVDDIARMNAECEGKDFIFFNGKKEEYDKIIK